MGVDVRGLSPAVPLRDSVCPQHYVTVPWHTQEWDRLGMVPCRRRTVKLSRLPLSSWGTAFVVAGGWTEDWGLNLFPKRMCLEQYVQVVPTEKHIDLRCAIKCWYEQSDDTERCWQTLAVIESFVPYLCVTLPWCGSFWYLGGCLHIGYGSKDAAVGAHRGPCRRDSARSVLSSG